MLLDIAGIIDGMMARLLGDAKTQVNLGLISLEEDPIKSFSDFKWNSSNSEDNLYELSSILASKQFDETGEDDAPKKDLLAEMSRLVNRRLLLRQMIFCRHEFDGMPKELLRAYSESADKGWKDRINEIAGLLILSMSQQITDNERLAKLFGE